MTDVAFRRNEVNFTNARQGVTWRLPFRVLDTNGAAVDIGLWSARGQARVDPESAAIAITFSCQILEHAAGDGSWVVWAKVDHTITEDVATTPTNPLNYDVEIVDPDTGEPFEVAYGTITVVGEVTK